MANITLATIAGYWKNISDWVKGTDAVSAPKVLPTGGKIEILADAAASPVSIPAGGNSLVAFDNLNYRDVEVGFLSPELVAFTNRILYEPRTKTSPTNKLDDVTVLASASRYRAVVRFQALGSHNFVKFYNDDAVARNYLRYIVGVR